MDKFQKTLSQENEEKNDLLRIEDKIYDMINKVMEENDSLNSFDFEDDDFEEDSLKISRLSTRHQTSDVTNSKFDKNLNSINQLFNLSNFNRGNKRNLTDALNHQNSVPSSFNTTFLSSKCPEIKNPSFFVQNNCGNNIFYHNLFQNSLKNPNNNNIFGLNNNFNQSFQTSQTFNTQYKNNTINNNITNSININNNISNFNNNANFIRNSQPHFKTVIYNNQKDVFNLHQPLFNLSQFGNNIYKENLFNNNTYSSLNLESNFHRNEKRKKTYDIPMTLQNNIKNFLKNDKNINKEKYLFNPQIEEKLFINNNDNNIENKNHSNKIDTCASDSFIYELKYELDKTGKIDYHIYNLVKGKFLSVIKNHKGSKIFQKYLKSSLLDEIVHLLYIELSQDLEEFITNPYANYFCKKFYLCLTQKDRIDLLKKIQNSIVRYSCDSVGTYPIQTIIENINSELEKVIIISKIKNHVEELIYDPFGCHVVERLLDCFEEGYISFLYSYISDNFLKLSYNNNGICIIKKILTYTHKQNMINKIKQIVKENSNNLIRHPYGNFVIQVIVESWSDYNDIIKLYKNKFFELSLDKYASNVIERFIERDEEILKQFIDEIINTNKIYEIMKSSYGNYVIQKAIKLSKNENERKLVFNSAKEINNLIENKLIQKWKTILLPHINVLTHEQIQELKENNYFAK